MVETRLAIEDRRVNSGELGEKNWGRLHEG